VAVNLPQGKNLVGAFYQPRLVLADVSTLSTLGKRELAEGWAEAIKHGLILDEELLRTFEQEGAAIASLDQEISTDVIRRSAAIKADVVSSDERDDMGVRVLLNYGHTIGHAIEAAAGYGRYLHGEAVSIGMMGAAMISNTMGMLSVEGVDRQRAVLEAFDLPVSFSGVDLAAVSEAMSVDKKMVSGAISWVLLEEPGRAVTRNDVPPEAVQDALRALQQ
jgi:3-dehydroquinate synthetase